MKLPFVATLKKSTGLKKRCHIERALCGVHERPLPSSTVFGKLQLEGETHRQNKRTHSPSQWKAVVVGFCRFASEKNYQWKPIEICSSPSEHKACGATTRHCRDGGQPRRGRGRRRVRRAHCAQRRSSPIRPVCHSLRPLIHAPPATERPRDVPGVNVVQRVASGGLPGRSPSRRWAASPCGCEASRSTSTEWRFADGRVLRWVGACFISAPAEASSAPAVAGGSPFVLIDFVLIYFSLTFLNVGIKQKN